MCYIFLLSKKLREIQKNFQVINKFVLFAKKCKKNYFEFSFRQLFFEVKRRYLLIKKKKIIFKVPMILGKYKLCRARRIGLKNIRYGT